MNRVTLDTTVGQLVADQPGRSRIFTALGIDYCCGGKQSLAQACREKGVDPETVRRLLDADVSAGTDEGRSWSEATLTELADHIETTHHAFLKNELPRLSDLVEKVTRVHGSHAPWLGELEELFKEFSNELTTHMIKEERVLFPLIRSLENGNLPGTDHCGGSVKNPIAVMEHEHDEAGRALARMRELSDDFTPPPGACNSFRAMLEGLAEVEADMHQHVHKENSILFPRAAEIEARLRN